MADQENVQISVQGKIFTLSKDFLISNSTYFDVMFSSNFREKSQKLVDLLDVDAFGFQLLVEYISSGSMKITETVANTISAYKCACFLQFGQVQTFCEEHLTREIDVDNCLKIYRAAKDHSREKLAVAAMSCATWNFKIIFNLNSFLEAESKDVFDLLARPELNVQGKNEWIVWERAIYPWIMKNEEERKEHLPHLVTCIDYTNMKLDEIDKIMNCSLVSENPMATEFLNRIVKSLKEKSLMDSNFNDFIDSLSCDNETKKKLKKFFTNFVPLKRFYSGVPWFIAFEITDKISGERSIQPTIICYDCKSDTVTELSKLPEPTTLGVGFRVCSVGYFLYVLGGQYQMGSNEWNKDVRSFDTVSKRWRKHEKLPRNRRHHMMCVVDSVIYLIGGYGDDRVALSSMDAYDTIQGEWLKNLPDIPFYVSGACCAYNQTILVFVEDKLFTYNVVSKSWSSEKVRSTNPRSYVSAICHNDMVYLLRFYSNEIYATNLCESKKSIEYFGSFPNNTENVCIVDDTLFSFSVDDNLKNKNIEDTVNIIEVIPLSEESEKECEALSIAYKERTRQNDGNEALSIAHQEGTQQNDGNEANENNDSSVNLNEDEPENEKIESSEVNVEDNHPQHSRQELKEDPDYESSPQPHNEASQGARRKTTSEQVPKLPKRGIIIWDSNKMSETGLSNIPFITGSSCHGCSTLFKLIE